MYAFEQDLPAYQKDRAGYYDLLCRQLVSLLAIERNPITVMAQASAFIMQTVPQLNWAGFYLTANQDQLVLGPYQGRLACVHIPFGQGVCGRVAEQQEPMMINDVHAFPGHIACDAASNSEIVIPLLVENTLLGVLDIDSPVLNRFTNDDLMGLASLAKKVIEAANWSMLSRD